MTLPTLSSPEVSGRVDVPVSLWEHLGELRKRLLVSLAGWLATTCAGWALSQRALDLLIRPPIEKLVYTTPTEPFFALCKIALIIGFLAVLPLWLYQLWLFVSPGLEPNERRLFLTLLPPAYGLFILGCAFSLKALVPLSLRFLMSFTGPHLQPYISLSSYLGYVTSLSLGIGVLFQLPIAMYILSAIGILHWETLAKYRRHAFLAILILAAIVTPSPDVFTQLVVALPTYALFEISILVSRLAGRPTAG